MAKISNPTTLEETTHSDIKVGDLFLTPHSYVKMVRTIESDGDTVHFTFLNFGEPVLISAKSSDPVTRVHPSIPLDPATV